MRMSCGGKWTVRRMKLGAKCRKLSTVRWGRWFWWNEQYRMPLFLPSGVSWGKKNCSNKETELFGAHDVLRPAGTRCRMQYTTNLNQNATSNNQPSVIKRASWGMKRCTGENSCPDKRGAFWPQTNTRTHRIGCTQDDTPWGLPQCWWCCEIVGKPGAKGVHFLCWILFIFSLWIFGQFLRFGHFHHFCELSWLLLSL